MKAPTGCPCTATTEAIPKRDARCGSCASTGRTDGHTLRTRRRGEDRSQTRFRHRQSRRPHCLRRQRQVLPLRNDPHSRRRILGFRERRLKSWRGPLGKTRGFAPYNDGLDLRFSGSGPPVFKHNEKYYMAYTANEHIALATADNPFDLSRNAATPPTAHHAPVRAIDPSSFRHRRKAYLYHVRLDHGNRIFVAELTDDLPRHEGGNGTRMPARRGRMGEHREGGMAVSEGPTVVK